MKIKTGIGQDSHRFENDLSIKKLILGGIIFENHPGLSGNSDADVVLHSITNAVSGVTGINILGGIADEMCLKNGITDSREYLKEALKHLGGFIISNISISIEGKEPKINPKINEMKKSIAGILNINKDDVGITATSGEELTEFGRGNGIQVISIITIINKEI